MDTLPRCWWTDFARLSAVEKDQFVALAAAAHSSAAERVAAGVVAMSYCMGSALWQRQAARSEVRAAAAAARRCSQWQRAKAAAARQSAPQQEKLAAAARRCSQQQRATLAAR